MAKETPRQGEQGAEKTASGQEVRSTSENNSASDGGSPGSISTSSVPAPVAAEPAIGEHMARPNSSAAIALLHLRQSQHDSGRERVRETLDHPGDQRPDMAQLPYQGPRSTSMPQSPAASSTGQSYDARPVRLDVNPTVAYRFQPYSFGPVSRYRITNMPLRPAAQLLPPIAPQRPNSPLTTRHAYDPTFGQYRKQRRKQACDYCHTRRIKCEGGDPCDNCIKQDVRCQWRTKKKRGPKPKAAAAPVDSEQQQQKPPGNSTAPLSYGSRTGSAADIQNLIVASEDGGSSVGISRASTPESVSLRRSASPEEGIPQSIEVPPANPPNAAEEPPTAAFSAPPAGDLMKEFYSDKVEPETREAVLAYFEYLYAYGPIFHPSTFIRGIVANEVDPLLIDILKARTSNYLNADYGRNVDVEALAARVKSQILFRLQEPTIETMQILLLLALVEVSCQRRDACAAIFASLSCLMLRFDWHEVDLYRTRRPASWDEWVEVETKRRIFWSAYQNEFLISSFQGWRTSIPESIVSVRCPCADSDWIDVDFTPPSPQQQNEAVAEQDLADPTMTSAVEGEAAATLSAEATLSSSSSSSAAAAAAAALPAAGKSVGSATMDVAGSIPMQRETQVVISGALSHSFALLCEYNIILGRVTHFLHDTRTARSESKGLETILERPMPAIEYLGPIPESGHLVYAIDRKGHLISDDPVFKRYADYVQRLSKRAETPQHLLDTSFDIERAKIFGTSDHRICVLRSRYLSLKSLACMITVALHSSNRRSFFDEYERPSELEPSLSSPIDPQEKILRMILNIAFGKIWGQGLLAEDIQLDSIRECVECSHDFACCLDREKDVPDSRFELTVGLGIVVALGVLLHQLRRCKKALGEADDTEMLLSAWDNELKRVLGNIKILWTTLQKMTAVWNIGVLIKTLKLMNIDEAAVATEQLSFLTI
ncbi:hypothetical protein DL89DRAFT_267470 [Linderina pennispora]|uniref:Zn(2)-C6 fungal-type domain-containing protein n=1 Tax=Linderina pennispora TaxID=61395 RepID=A0A1Y1W9N5_9FUNG|nr:uncharacterized protein DL89DRAFT_267470 [Linderina pennispora]ORX70249.1 hypothetical protein DL89DRAFT_267470 [Linderina pennispora]